MAQVRMNRDDADGNLPPVCMRCGAPATVTVSKKLRWHPGLLYAIWMFPAILAKHARIQAPFCDRHKRHWTNRSIVFWGCCLCPLLLVAAMYIIEAPRRQELPGFLCLGSVILSMAWMTTIAGRILFISAGEITDRAILLRGVAPAFVEAVEKAEAARRDLLFRDTRGDEEKPIPLIQKQPPTDAIKDNARPVPPMDAIEE